MGRPLGPAVKIIVFKYNRWEKRIEWAWYPVVTLDRRQSITKSIKSRQNLRQGRTRTDILLLPNLRLDASDVQYINNLASGQNVWIAVQFMQSINKPSPVA